MKLWIFGHSACLPYDIDPESGWPELLRQQFDCEYENFAAEGADNLYIYHTIVQNYRDIDPGDIVIVGWSHPNRKSFVLDRQCAAHQSALENPVLVFSSQPEFFRSQSIISDNQTKWSLMKPKQKGYPFFDTWYDNYFNDYECRLNFQSYQHSAKLLLSKTLTLSFYFSQESVDTVMPCDFYWLDFIIEQKVAISSENMHPNAQGHAMIADLFFKQLSLQLSLPLTTA